MQKENEKLTEDLANTNAVMKKYMRESQDLE
jgi:hypothetical protein